MLSLAGALLGLFTSALPNLIGLWKAKGDRQHELAILDRQLESQKALGVQRLGEIKEEGDIRESEALYKAAAPVMSGVGWIDAVLCFANGIVRPGVTFAYFGLYVGIKYAAMMMVMAAGQQWQVALQNVWNQEDVALFATIMGFWFGQRNLAKNRATS